MRDIRAPIIISRISFQDLIEEKQKRPGGRLPVVVLGLEWFVFEKSTIIPLASFGLALMLNKFITIILVAVARNLLYH
jgi:hypothetical protein